MSETTEILFNHPALHSLKRDQLVKLCKIHSIKANGKNTELIERLKKHAETLPRNSPLSVATRSEPGGISPADKEGDEMAIDPPQLSGSHWGFQAARPSEQWEVVMDAIEEMIEENSADSGTMSSQKTTSTECSEFGTGFSKSSSVTSSIRSIASSLGFKRGPFGDSSTFSSTSSLPSSATSADTVAKPVEEPTKKASDAPMGSAAPSTPSLPISDLGEIYEPLPGQSLRAGVPAPPNARLSLGLNAKAASQSQEQPTTTIRLITKPAGKPVPQTPQLKPFKTAFELEVGSPHGNGFGGTLLWPNEEKSVYPALPVDSPFKIPIPMASMTSVARTLAEDAETMPGGLEPLPNPHSRDPSLKLPNPHPQPGTPTEVSPNPSPSASMSARPAFVFGSPLPQHNVTNDQFKSAAASVLEEMNKRLLEDGVNEVEVGILNKLQPGAHANGVESMSSKTSTLAAKTGPGIKEKFNKQHEAEFAKMEGIDAAVKRKASVTSTQSRRSSYGAGRDRFGRRTGSSVGRVSTTSRVTSTSSKHKRVLPGAFEVDDDDDGIEEEKPAEVQVPSQNTGNSGETLVEQEKTMEEIEQEKRQKEKEVIRRKLEISKAKRRSSAVAGRVSVGRGGVLHKPQAQPKPRFGFFSSAKNLVKSVWDKGKKLTNTPKANKVAPPPTKPASGTLQRKVSTASINARVSTSRPPSSLGTKPPTVQNRPQDAKRTNVLASSATTASSIRNRATTPSFAPARTNTMKTQESREGSAQPQETGVSTLPITPAPAMVQPNVPSSIRSNASVGSAARKPSGKTSTLTTRASGGSLTSIRPRPRMASASSATSRLLAPTASSLARAAATRKSMPVTSPKVNENGALTSITNMAGKAQGVVSPRPGGIFSKPLTLPSTGISKLQARTASGSSTATGLSRNTSVASKASTTSTDSKRSATRKPRISRSKVIAKLASQRAANTEGPAPGSAGPSPDKPKVGATPRASEKRSRTRSSMGTQAKRSSFAGVITGKKAAAGDAVLASAKKRLRQSEYYARRASNKPVQPLELGVAEGDGMDVDE